MMTSMAYITIHHILWRKFNYWVKVSTDKTSSSMLHITPSIKLA